MAIQLDDGIVFPRGAVRFPVELRQPPGMRLDDPATWPGVEGRLELVAGRLLYMPPCADYQQDVAADVTYVLRAWSESHHDYLVGGNEAGMLLGGEIRAADAAVWRAADATPRIGRLRGRPPVLAVEVAGEDESESDLRSKARWYLDHGVSVVWILLPRTFELLAIDVTSECRLAKDERLSPRAELPDLSPQVSEFFAQLLRSR